MTDPRLTEARAFLEASGWAGATLAPLAGDASNRRYLRVATAGRAAVLMDAPPVRGEDIRPFVAMTEWLREAHLSAPEVLAAGFADGFLLLEDLGDALFARHVLRQPGQEEALYAAAVDLLVEIARIPPPAEIGTGPARQPLAPYDAAVLAREARLIVDWWVPMATGRTPQDVDGFLDLIRGATASVAGARSCVVLRDYHAENLLWLPDRAGHARVGLLDYQDALAGHPAYDLVSLLEDARRDTSEALQEAMLSRYLAARPELEGDAFRAAYAALGAQRNLKIIGIFARLAKRDGKPRYLDLLPRVWSHLQRDLAHPGLAPLAAWVAEHVPEPTPDLLARLAAEAAS